MNNKLKNIIKYYIPFKYREVKIYEIYRKSHKSFLRGNRFLANYYENKIYKKFGCIISQEAIIGENLRLPHPIGIVIGSGVKIGKDCVIYQNVTIGRKYREIPEYPEIGENVIIYANSMIIGKIKIGSNSTLGCNSVVLKSIPENSRCMGVIK